MNASSTSGQRSSSQLPRTTSCQRTAQIDGQTGGQPNGTMTERNTLHDGVALVLPRSRPDEFVETQPSFEHSASPGTVIATKPTISVRVPQSLTASAVRISLQSRQSKTTKPISRFMNVQSKPGSPSPAVGPVPSMIKCGPRIITSPNPLRRIALKIQTNPNTAVCRRKSPYRP